MKLHLPPVLRTSLLARTLSTPVCTLVVGIVIPGIASSSYASAEWAPPDIVYANAVNVTGNGAQTVTENTVFTISSSSVGSITATGHDVKLVGATNSGAPNASQSTLAGNASFTANSVWISQGRFQMTAAALNDKTPTVYVQGGQLYFTGGTASSNFFIGSSSYSEGDTYGNCALRFQGGTDITGSVTLVEDAAVTVAQNQTGRIMGALIGTDQYAFTKKGDGMFVFQKTEGSQTFNKLVLQGGTFRLLNNGSAATAYNMAVDVGTLDIAKSSTISQNKLSSAWTIGNLMSSANNSANFTLTLDKISSGNQRQKFIFNGTDTLQDNQLFAGTIDLKFNTTAAASDGKWQMEMHVGTDQLRKATVKLSSYSILAVTDNRATIAGLTSADANAHVFSGANTGTANTTSANNNNAPYYVTDGQTRTLTLAGGGTYDYKGKIGDNLTLTKTGAGTQSLAAIGDNVTVNHNAGTLKLNGTVGTGFTLNHADDVTIVFGANANMGVYSLSLSNLAVGGTVNAGTTLTVSQSGTLGTAADGFTLNGGTIDFGDISAGSGYTPLAAEGAVRFTSGSLTIDGLSSLGDGGSFTLMSGGAGTTWSGDFTGITVNGSNVDDKGLFYQDIGGTNIQFLIAAQPGDNAFLTLNRVLPATLTWAGNGDTWQTGASGWNKEGVMDGSASFSNFDEVVFTGAANPETVTIAGEVTPLTISVSEGEYIFNSSASESGSISGTAALTLGNEAHAASKLTVNLDNAHWSGSAELLEGGTLVLGHNNALGASSLNFNGGTLEYGSGVTKDISGQISSSSGTIKVAVGEGNAVTWATNVLASHAIEKSGAGSLTLTLAAGAYSSALTVSAGDVTLKVASGTATYTGAMTGNGSVVKSGAGTLLISPTATLTGINLRVDAGILQLGNNNNTMLAATVAPESIVLGNNATLKFLAKTSTLNSKLTMGNGSTLTIDDSMPTNPSFKVPSLLLDGQVTLSGGTAKISCQYGRILRIDSQIAGNGKLQMTNSYHTEWGANFTISLTNAENDFTGGIELLRRGGHVWVNHAGALGTGILNLSHAQSTLQYDGAANADGTYDGTTNADGTYDSMKGGTDQIITGAGGVEVVSGNLELKNTNTYTGATTVTTGSLKVSGSIGTSASANAYVVKNGASLVVSGTGSIANSSVAISAQQPAVAPLSDDTPEAEGTLRNVTVNTEKITRTDAAAQATIDNGKIDIAAATYTIENVALTNSLITLQNAGALTLSNVAIGAGTSIKGASAVTLGGNTTLVMTQTNTQLNTAALNTDTHTLSVSSNALAQTSVSGSLTLDLTEQWVYALVDAVKELGNFTTIALTFTDIQVDVDTWNGVALTATGALDTFSNLSVTHGNVAGQVIISTAPQNIPEPATATLGLAGLAALLLLRRRRA